MNVRSHDQPSHFAARRLHSQSAAVAKGAARGTGGNGTSATQWTRNATNLRPNARPARKIRALFSDRFCRSALIALATLCAPRLVAEEYSNAQSNGPVSVTTSLSPSDPIIGDEVTLTFEIVAEKDVEVIPPEFEEIAGRFVVTSYVPSKKITSDGGEIRTERYTLQTGESGEQSIPPYLIEFIDNRPGRKSTPDDAVAYEIETERIDFTVQSFLPTDASLELKPPMPVLELPSERVSAVGWLAAASAIVAVLGVAGFLIWFGGRKKAKKANAYELARARLQRLLDNYQSSHSALSAEQFFVEISSIIRRYLEDRFELRAPELTTDEFLQLAARGSELSREHQKLLSEFLQQADVVKFAGVQATQDDTRHSSNLAAQFLEETRSNAPEIEISDEALVPRPSRGPRNPDGSPSAQEVSADA